MARNNLRICKLGSKNPMWKGDAVGYPGIHDYIKARKYKPKKCQCCGEKKKLDLANISQKYKRDLSDWEYICRKCHMTKDGRLQKAIKRAAASRTPDKKCLYCGKMFHRDSCMREAKCCSRVCASKNMWNTVLKHKRRPLRKCKTCKKIFYPVNLTHLNCSRKCGSKYGLAQRKKIHGF